VKTTAPATELAQGYEALRAQALGELPPLTPRGLAVFLCAGLASWMSACPPRPELRSTAGVPAGSRGVHALTAGSAELVLVLAEMALSSQRRCPL
jgi:hypothetical protein